MRWLLDMRDGGHVALTYSLFSLELNASGPALPFEEGAPTYGRALAALAAARRERGEPGFEDLFIALGRRLHDDGIAMSDDLLVQAAAGASLDEVVARATGPELGDLGRLVVAEYLAARERDVFGVPTLAIGDDKVVYGPILAVAPTGADGLELWRQVKGLADRDTFFELKRWPRDERPQRPS
jgi:hypothetical protein